MMGWTPTVVDESSLSARIHNALMSTKLDGADDRELHSMCSLADTSPPYLVNLVVHVKHPLLHVMQYLCDFAPSVTPRLVELQKAWVHTAEQKEQLVKKATAAAEGVEHKEEAASETEFMLNNQHALIGVIEDRTSQLDSLKDGRTNISVRDLLEPKTAVHTMLHSHLLHQETLTQHTQPQDERQIALHRVRLAVTVATQLCKPSQLEHPVVTRAICSEHVQLTIDLFMKVKRVELRSVEWSVLHGAAPSLIKDADTDKILRECWPIITSVTSPAYWFMHGSRSEQSDETAAFLSAIAERHGMSKEEVLMDPWMQHCVDIDAFGIGTLIVELLCALLTETVAGPAALLKFWTGYKQVRLS